jgi:hypothetical protein
LSCIHNAVAAQKFACCPPQFRVVMPNNCG